MEDRGIISGYQGSKPREVLISKERWQELNMAPSTIQNNNKTDANDFNNEDDGENKNENESININIDDNNSDEENM